MNKQFALILILINFFLVLLPTTSHADDLEMSIARTSLYGRVVFRTDSIENFGSSVETTFVMLFPEHAFPADFFNNEPPATFYKLYPSSFFFDNAQNHAFIEPPFGGFNLKDIPFGSYWLCKFDVEYNISQQDFMNQDSLMLSGCQYIVLNTPNSIKQNFYMSSSGFWIDDIIEENAAQPLVPPPSQTDETTCEE